MIKRFLAGLCFTCCCCGLLAQEAGGESSPEQKTEQKTTEDDSTQGKPAKEPVKETSEDTPAKEKTKSTDVRKLEKEKILDSREAMLKMPGSGSLVTQEVLEKYEFDDVHKVLFLVPGVYFRQEDGYGLRPNIGIRGANSDRSAKVTLMEDDVLVGPAPYSAPAAYYFPMVTRMTDVSVIKGPAGVIYGPNTIGGAINLKTRDIPMKSQGQLDIAGGLNEYLKGHVYYGNTIGNFGFLGEFLHNSTSGFKTIDYNKEDSTGFAKEEGMVKLNYTIDKQEDFYHQFELKAGFAAETSHESYLGLTDDDFEAKSTRRYAASERDKMKWGRSEVVGKYVLGIGDSLMIKTNVYRFDFSRKWDKFNRFKGGPNIANILEYPESGQEAVYHAILTGSQDSTNDDEKLQIGLNNRVFVSQGVQSDAEWEYEGSDVKQRVTLGLRLHYDSIKRDQIERSYWMQNHHLVSDGSPFLQLSFEKASTLAFAGYLKYELDWNKLKVIPGVRYEKIYSELDDWLHNKDTKSDQYAFLPGVGIFYEFTDSFSVLTGVHKGFSPIAPGQDPAVKQEESVNYELGFRFQNATFFAELVGFFNNYSNLTSVGTFSSGSDSTTLDKQFNAGKVYIFGLELTMNKAFHFANGLTLTPGIVYSYTDSEFQSDFISSAPQFGTVSKGDRLPYVPKHQVNFSFGVDYKKCGVTLNLKGLSSMKEQAGKGGALEGKETDSYMVVDLSGVYRFNEKHQIYARVDNLLNEEYIVSRRPYGARPGMPIFAVLGYKFSF